MFLFTAGLAISIELNLNCFTVQFKCEVLMVEAKNCIWNYQRLKHKYADNQGFEKQIRDNHWTLRYSNEKVWNDCFFH